MNCRCFRRRPRRPRRHPHHRPRPHHRLLRACSHH